MLRGGGALPPVLEREISIGFCPTPVDRSARTCQGADTGLPSVPAVDDWRSPSLFTRGLNESIGEGGRGVSQYVPANAPNQ